LSETKPILITGATGLVGKSLIPELYRRHPDRPIRILTRRPEGIQSVAGIGVQAHRWDPQGGQLDVQCLVGVSHVVHLAGEPVAQRWTEASRARIRSSRIRALEMLTDAAKRLAHAPKVISASAIGCYPPGDALRTEGDGCGTGFLAEVVRDWEDAAREFGALGGGHILFRIGLVLSRHGGVLERLLPIYRMGLGAPLSPGSQWQSWIQLDDLIAMIADSTEHANWNGTYNAVSPHPVSQREFSRTLAAVMSRPHFLPPVPAWALRLRFGHAAEALLASHRVLPKRLEAEGFTFTHPTLEEALQAALH